MPDRSPLSSAAKPLPKKTVSRWTPLLIFGVSFLLTVGAYLYLRHESRLDQQTRLAHEAALVAKEIRERLHSHAQHLRGLRAFITVRGVPNTEEWHAYAGLLDIKANLSGMQAYGFAPYVATEDIDRYVESTRITDPGFEIRPMPATGFALPIRHISPDIPSNRLVRGYDLNDAPIRAEAIGIARDRNDLAVSRRIELVQDAEKGGGDSPGFLMALPVYRQGAEIDSVEKRREAFTGVVYAAYRMQDFMNTLAHPGAGLRIFDEDPTMSERGGSERLPLFDNSTHAPHATFVETREIHFGARSWHLHLTPAPSSGFDLTALFPPAALAGGLLVSLLLGLLSYAQSRSREQALVLAGEITRELRLSEERFQLAAAGTEDGIWDRDLRRGTVWLSPRLRSILGFPGGRETIEVAVFMEHVHPADRTLLTETIERHFQDRQPYVAEYRFQRDDGGQIWLSSRGQAVWNGDEPPSRMVGAITDVSGRKQAEAQIAYYRAYFATVIKFMPHPIFVKDRERRFITVSHAFCELLGTDEREIIGKVEMGNSTLPAEVGRIIREMDERALAGSGDQIAECTLPLAAGSRRVLIRKTLIADPDGEPLIVGTLTDLTDLRVAERANEAKSEFLANISHELRTPLHSILSFASLGGDRAKGGGQDKLLHYFDRIQQSGGRLLALVNDLLELSKLEAGKMHLTPVPQDILAPIRDVITEVETLAAERQIRIDIADCCTDTVVAIDGTRFPQVMRNVLSNAIKYSPPERTVRIFLTDSRLSRGRRATDLPEIPALEIEVRDEGIGIPEDELDTIFDKFVQSSRTNTGAGGTGLGLAISREIVLAHRGHIRARNNPGGGASFFVTLPRAVQPGH